MSDTTREDEDHLLIALMEECSEISEQCSRAAIRVSKALRFGRDEVQPGQLLDNSQRVVAELGDLRATAEYLEEIGVLPPDHRARKRKKLDAFLRFARGETPHPEAKG
jgi:hypothetical protein